MTGVLVRDVGSDEVRQQLQRTGLPLRIGPFDIHLSIAVSEIVEVLYCLYADYPILDEQRIFSFRAALSPRRKLPRLDRKMVRFLVDGRMPHEDMPAGQALAVLEWGINLVIALRSHAFLTLHSAVVEKNGAVMLLPAAPGFGKTTLCAALCHRGWRLLSDEFGLVRPDTGQFSPVPRPMALKNHSIEVFRNFAPDAYVGPRILNTRKGTVAHVKPPAISVFRQQEDAPPKWVVFPRWQEDAVLSLEPMSKSEGFLLLARNAFNYELLGETGFSAVRDIILRSSCHSLTYSDLDEAVIALNELADDEP